MGPVTIAVDSYGPVTDNAQSVFELSLIEDVPASRSRSRRNTGSTWTSTWQGPARGERRRRQHVQGDGQAGAHRTAVVGATTMIFSIIMVLTEGLRPELLQNLSIMHPPFLLG